MSEYSDQLREERNYLRAKLAAAERERDEAKAALALGGELKTAQCCDPAIDARIGALLAERDELRKDKERLDWLAASTVSISSHPTSIDLFWKGHSYRRETLRTAIDAAMKEENRG